MLKSWDIVPCQNATYQHQFLAIPKFYKELKFGKFVSHSHEFDDSSENKTAVLTYHPSIKPGFSKRRLYTYTMPFNLCIITVIYVYQYEKSLELH